MGVVHGIITIFPIQLLDPRPECLDSIAVLHVTKNVTTLPPCVLLLSQPFEVTWPWEQMRAINSFVW